MSAATIVTVRIPTKRLSPLGEDHTPRGHLSSSALNAPRTGSRVHHLMWITCRPWNPRGNHNSVSCADRNLVFRINSHHSFQRFWRDRATILTPCITDNKKSQVRTTDQNTSLHRKERNNDSVFLPNGGTPCERSLAAPRTHSSSLGSSFDHVFSDSMRHILQYYLNLQPGLRDG